MTIFYGGGGGGGGGGGAYSITLVRTYVLYEDFFSLTMAPGGSTCVTLTHF